MVATRKFRNGGKCYDVHGMLKIKPWPTSKNHNPRNLNGTRFYKFINIILNVHVIPNDGNINGISYVNNYIDFEQFNIFHDLDFETKNTRIVLTVKKACFETKKKTDYEIKMVRNNQFP